MIKLVFIFYTVSDLAGLWQHQLAHLWRYCGECRILGGRGNRQGLLVAHPKHCLPGVLGDPVPCQSRLQAAPRVSSSSDVCLAGWSESFLQPVREQAATPGPRLAWGKWGGHGPGGSDAGRDAQLQPAVAVSWPPACDARPLCAATVTRGKTSGLGVSNGLERAGTCPSWALSKASVTSVMDVKVSFRRVDCSAPSVCERMLSFLILCSGSERCTPRSHLSCSCSAVAGGSFHAVTLRTT